MKFTEVFITEGDKREGKASLEEFAKHELAKSPFGGLIIALAKEHVWSNEYEMWACLTPENPHLIIRHPTFIRPLEVDGRICAEWSVQDVEDVIRKHINESQEWLQPQIKHLQGQITSLYRMGERINWDKARAAVLETFGLVVSKDLEPYHEGPNDLYAFGKIDSERMFVARKIGNEFTGGVAKLNLSFIDWHKMSDGVSLNERHGAFWAALAEAFVTRTFDISEKDLRCEGVVAFKKPWEFMQTEQYAVEKAVFEFSGRDDDVIIEVKFGNDNLPERAFIEQKVLP